MSTKLNNVRLSLRRDTLENWNVISNHVLLSGEIAIVTKDNEENIKIGNGISSFASLPYLFQHQLKSDNIIADKVTAHSISQGYHVESSNTSFATGIFTEAEGQFGTVHGIEAKISDDYAFVFNGVNFPNIDDRYFSHGEGTFNVNPKDGIGGFYIGDTSLSDILQEYSEDFKTYTNSVVAAAVQESHIYTDGKISSLNESISAVSSSIEIIGSDYLDSNDKIDILNRCVERDEIKFYYGPQEKQISLSVDTGSGEPLVQTVTLSAFFNKAETDDRISSSVVPVQDQDFTVKVATIAGKDINVPKSNTTTIRRWYT